MNPESRVMPRWDCGNWRHSVGSRKSFARSGLRVEMYQGLEIGLRGKAEEGFLRCAFEIVHNRWAEECGRGAGPPFEPVAGCGETGKPVSMHQRCAIYRCPPVGARQAVPSRF
jgi:hypothetical protein